MSEMHLKQPGFTYSACSPFTKKKQRIQKFMPTVDTRYTYQNKLDEGCYQHDMTYGSYKDFVIRTEFDKALRNKAFKTAGDPTYQTGSASMVHKMFNKKSDRYNHSGSVINNEN